MLENAIGTIGEPTITSPRLIYQYVSSHPEETVHKYPHGKLALTDEFASDNSDEIDGIAVGLVVGLEAGPEAELELVAETGFFRMPPMTPPMTAARIRIPRMVPYMRKNFFLLNPQIR